MSDARECLLPDIWWTDAPDSRTFCERMEYTDMNSDPKSLSINNHNGKKMTSDIREIPETLPAHRARTVMHVFVTLETHTRVPHVSMTKTEMP